MGFDSNYKRKRNYVVKSHFKTPNYLSELNDIFKAFTKKKKLGKILISSLDVIFEEGVNRVQPDLIYISNENKDTIKDWIR